MSIEVHVPGDRPRILAHGNCSFDEGLVIVLEGVGVEWNLIGFALRGLLTKPLCIPFNTTKAKAGWLCVAGLRTIVQVWSRSFMVIPPLEVVSLMHLEHLQSTQ